MPTHKVCYLCSNSTTKTPDISFFIATEQIVKYLNLPKNRDIFICDEHFDEKDLKSHGVKKRLNHGALPVSFPKKEAFLLDHGYFCTAPLDLVSVLYIYSNRIAIFVAI